jgi:hypothetical protein
VASEVDIANLALARLGDNATVASLNPPEGSAQAEHCARFYPMARDSLLEMHPWGFSTTRVSLALLGTGWPEWDYTYAQPNDAINIIAVISPTASDDYSIGTYSNDNQQSMSGGNYVPQPFSCEVDSNGNQVIYTDLASAVLRYTSRVDDTTKFSPLFTDALAWLLASYLAGPILKGDAGAAASRSCLSAFNLIYSKAITSDANQRKVNPVQNVSWMAAR